MVEASFCDDRLRPGLHRPQLGEVVGAEATGPEVFRGRRFEQSSGGHVARGVARLQQRLELPGAGPPVPVGDVGVDRPHEHAGATLRAEVGVDAKRSRTDRDHRACERRIDVGSVRGDQEDVDVARVVELLRPVLAHGDDRQAVFGPGKADGAGEHSIGDQRECTGHLLEVGQAVEIMCGDLEEGKMLPAYQVLDIVRLSGVPAHLAGVGDRAGRFHAQSRQHVQRRRIGDDHARQRVAGSCDRCEPGGKDRLGLQPFAGLWEHGEELVGYQPHRVGSRGRADELVEQLWRWHK